jgi:hypothetical protein
MKPNFRISGGQSLAVSLAALIVCSGFVTTPATAGGGDVAAGLAVRWVAIAIQMTFWVMLAIVAAVYVFDHPGEAIMNPEALS